jgi:hypothetical protein
MELNKGFISGFVEYEREEVVNRNTIYGSKTQKSMSLLYLLCQCRDGWKWKRKKETKERLRKKKLWADQTVIVEVIIKENKRS